MFCVVQDDRPRKRRRPNAAERRALKAATVQTFIQQYGRKAQRGGADPDDRAYDNEVRQAVERMKPERLDQLLRDDED